MPIAATDQPPKGQLPPQDEAFLRLEHDACYAVIVRKDRRFDGLFFTGVVTTGIFCRPSCPARTPGAANVSFYPHAAAATEAGFRPCRRCRPELAPGDPEWNRRADLAGRAVRLIADGVVDTEGVAGLARRLAVGPRHLRRQLQAELGAGPSLLARSRRLSTARLLLDQTDLSVSDIAFASGFGSIRQFNEAFRATFQASPTELRRQPSAAVSPATDQPLTIRLAARDSVDWPGLHRFLAARAIEGLETATDNSFRRNVPGGWVAISVTPEPDSQTRQGEIHDRRELQLSCSLDRLDHLAKIVSLVRRVTDLDADRQGIAAELAADPTLALMLQQTGLPALPGAFDPFEMAVRAIIGQQVSVAGARTTLGRLVSLVFSDRTDHTGFPTASEILDAPLDELPITSRRRATIIALANAVDGGDIDLSTGTDRTATVAALQQIPGIGPWTSGYMAMRSLGDPDGWPSGDLILRRAAAEPGQAPLSTAELDQRAESWRPWRAYAAMLLWANASPAPRSIPTPHSTRQK